jgi:hypothetical protein
VYAWCGSGSERHERGRPNPTLADYRLFHHSLANVGRFIGRRVLIHPLSSGFCLCTVPSKCYGTRKPLRIASHRPPPSARYHCTACAIVARTNHAISFRIAQTQPFLLPGIEFGSHEPVSMCTVCKDTNSMPAPPQHSTTRPHLTYRNVPQDPRANQRES